MTSVLSLMLIGWLLLCVWCGYARRFKLFVLLVIVCVAMVFVLVRETIGVDPMSANALMSYLSAVLAALGALGLGWIIGRIVRSFRDSDVRG